MEKRPVRAYRERTPRTGEVRPGHIRTRVVDYPRTSVQHVVAVAADDLGGSARCGKPTEKLRTDRHSANLAAAPDAADTPVPQTGIVTADRHLPTAEQKYHRRVTRSRTGNGPTERTEQANRWMLRARDAIDRDFAQPLDIATLAAIAHVSPAHFIRTFRAVFGETPHRYLQRRRVERAAALLRDTDRSVTQICLQVGFSSVGTFSRTFRDIIGSSPVAYRRRTPPTPAPTCFTMTWGRTSSFG